MTINMTSLSIALTLTLGLGACAVDPIVVEGEETADMWCRSVRELAAEARMHLVKEDLFAMSEFDFDAWGSMPIGDINGDDVDDLIILPGVQFSGNQEATVFLSDNGKLCVLNYAGSLGGISGASIVESSDKGMKDLDVYNLAQQGCNLETLTYSYDSDSQRFAPNWESAREDDLCEDLESGAPEIDL